MSCSSKLSNQRRGSWEPLTHGWLVRRKNVWEKNLTFGIGVWTRGQSDKTEPLTWGAYANRLLVSELFNVREKTSHIWCQNIESTVAQTTAINQWRQRIKLEFRTWPKPQDQHFGTNSSIHWIQSLDQPSWEQRRARNSLDLQGRSSILV